jgi:hypothetical protein
MRVACKLAALRRAETGPILGRNTPGCAQHIAWRGAQHVARPESRRAPLHVSARPGTTKRTRGAETAKGTPVGRALVTSSARG